MGACVAAYAGAALAQGAGSQNQMAQFGGSMHAVAEHCGDYTAAQLADMKAQQQSAMTGISASDFDAAFNAGREQTRKKIADGTPEQRAQMCQQMRSMPKP